MARFSGDLEREMERIRPPAFGLDDVRRRRRRRATVRRIEAGVVALVVAGIGTAAALLTLSNSGETPAVPTTPHAVAAFPVGERPSGVAVAAGSLWVGHRTLPEVWRIDPATGRVQARIPTGSGGPVAVAAGDGQVWAVATSTPGSVLERIDPASDAVVASRPLPIVVDTLAVRNGRVWLASRSGGVVLVLSDGGRRLARVEVPGGPSALALDTDGAWVTGGSDGALTRIALPSFAASSSIRPGGRLSGVVDCAGRLWVATGEGNLDRVDPRSGAVRPIGAGRFLSAVASDGRVVWAVDGAGGDATAVDCSTGRVVGAVPAGREATAVVAAAGSAWIVDSGRGVVIEVTT